MLPIQRSFTELGTALVDTTFVVVDLETTGGSPIDSQITEIGAVKVRGGDVIGEFSTLVDPGGPIPPFITVLTGITNAMVIGAPKIDEALPTFLEFAGPDSVLVAHNAAFDARFLSHESARLGYRDWSPPVVCTVRLARRLVRDEVPNLRLATLASALRGRTPCHRALADARATTDVLHALLELAGRWGVTHLDDLLWFQTAGGHPQARKRVLAQDLPRERGVYLFRDAHGTLLYVGKATNLRARVRSYFSGDDRRRVDDLLRELATVEHIVARCDLEASVLEARLIRAHRPAYNRAQRGRAAPAFLRLTTERYPRLTIARSPGEGTLGPMARAAADAVREAIEEATSLRRCSDRIGARTRFAACVLAELGRCAAPCEGRVEPADYADTVRPATRALAGDPTSVIEALEARLQRLVAQERYEEAASTRDRIGAVVAATGRARAADALRRAGVLAFETDGVRVEIAGGFLSRVDAVELVVPPDDHPDEPRLIATWLARAARHIRLLDVAGTYALPAAGGRAIATWASRVERARRDRGDRGNASPDRRRIGADAR
jgi:DNA polymerase-3 subunit epsilon